MNVVVGIVGWVLSQNHSLFTFYKKKSFLIHIHLFEENLHSRSYRKVVGIYYPESKVISNICNMFWVASVIYIRVGTHHVSISVSLFRFGRIRIAIALDHITKFILGMVLRGFNTF